jgi:hypothetical protein
MSHQKQVAKARTLSKAQQTIWEAYHTGKISSAEMNRRTQALVRKRIAHEAVMRKPLFHA